MMNSMETEKILIFRQTLPFLFEPGQWNLPPDSSTENFSNLNDLERFRWNDGNFHFLLTWPRNPNVRYEWLQKSNPVKSFEVDGYEPIKLPSSKLYEHGGLKRSNLSLLATARENDWRCAVGSFKLWKGGIPTCTSHIESQVELYALRPTDNSGLLSDLRIAFVGFSFGLVLVMTCIIAFFYCRPKRNTSSMDNSLYLLCTEEREKQLQVLGEWEISPTTEDAPQMFSPYFSEKRKSKLTKAIIHSIIDGNVTARISERYGKHSRTLSSAYQRPPSAFAQLKRRRREATGNMNKKEEDEIPYETLIYDEEIGIENAEFEFQRDIYGETSDSAGFTLTKETISNWSKDTLLDKEMMAKPLPTRKPSNSSLGGASIDSTVVYSKTQYQGPSFDVRSYSPKRSFTYSQSLHTNSAFE